MKAKEAKRITEVSLKGPAIESLLRIAYGRIKKVAEQGKNSVSHPFYGYTPYPDSVIIDAAIQQANWTTEIDVKDTMKDYEEKK